jgi:rhodanese-related sulfurtransferase
LAGATHMTWLRFISYSTLGSAAWIGVALLGGMLFRHQIEQILPRLASIGISVALVIGIAIAVYIAYKWWERTRFYTMLRMARIDVSQLYELMDQGVAPLIVDVRSPTALGLDPRRIPGAMHIPLLEVEQYVRDLPRDREIVAYCTCPNEASAAQVAKLLMNHGFKKVRPLHGGLDAWVAAGYKVDLFPVGHGKPVTQILVSKP